jgi:UDP-glucose 4-epimerase
VAERFAAQAAAGEPPVVYGDGTQARDFIHVSDVARMVGLALGNPSALGQAFNCGTGRATNVSELAALAIKASGKRLEPARAPARRGDIPHIVADMSKARKALGFKPAVTLKKGLASLI